MLSLFVRLTRFVINVSNSQKNQLPMTKNTRATISAQPRTLVPRAKIELGRDRTALDGVRHRLAVVDAALGSAAA